MPLCGATNCHFDRCSDNYRDEAEKLLFQAARHSNPCYFDWSVTKRRNYYFMPLGIQSLSFRPECNEAEKLLFMPLGIPILVISTGV